MHYIFFWKNDINIKHPLENRNKKMSVCTTFPFERMKSRSCEDEWQGTAFGRKKSTTYECIVSIKTYGHRLLLEDMHAWNSQRFVNGHSKYEDVCKRTAFGRKKLTIHERLVSKTMYGHKLLLEGSFHSTHEALWTEIAFERKKSTNIYIYIYIYIYLSIYLSIYLYIYIYNKHVTEYLWTDIVFWKKGNK